MPLTPRTRLLTALDHREPDRVPILIGASNATTLDMRAARHLAEYLGLDSPGEFLYDWPELGSALPCEPMLQRLRSDARGLHDRQPLAVRQRNRSRPPHTPYYDDWGIGQVEIEPGVWFPHLHPLTECDSLDILENYPWPDMGDPTRLSHLPDELNRLYALGDYALFGAPWLLFPFERALALQGMETFLSNLALQPDFAQAVLRKTTDLCMQLMGSFLAAAGESLDIIKIGDDLGTQERLLISPRMYRQILKPLHAEYIAFIKSRTAARVFFHTDGDVSMLLDDLVEIGVDILNPIQTHAGGMADLAALKQRYGANLIFCGALDTQRLLPYGAPSQVRDEVRRVIQMLAPGGGYILSAVHTIPDNVPPANILVMIDAAQEFGAYPF